MFDMPGGSGYSRRMASVVEFVRNRILPPLGDRARSHTGFLYVSLSFAGRRKSSPPFSPYHGSPSISICGLGSCSQRSGGSSARTMEKAAEISRQKEKRQVIMMADYMPVPGDGEELSGQSIRYFA